MDEYRLPVVEDANSGAILCLENDRAIGGYVDL
jgi:hypothetical protein